MESPEQQRLCGVGLLLFLVGLAVGFGVQASPSPRGMLAAHLTGVQSATFLVALGLLWPRLRLGPAATKLLSSAIWISFVALETGMILIGLRSPGMPGAVVKGIGIWIGLSTVCMFIAIGMLVVLFLFRRSPGKLIHAH
jgi:hypothetical protein